ncbi:class I SAM-dependent methyltransferase [Aquisalinus flavus]|uniref:SAM-dependent methyltransferase n=1 Tax=Aquisalinus flavus TaxID=1526572 RepID=A0A8J2Y3V7_9PROT|nr:methyltransferase domain-containing protein [Aquisalinus flavus]MBD0426123.1 methyltransferase domain-containing protein [Aquisalinus flavus]UNE48292.1 class I SAM-dependent methyltransferase [Aquisalinus flavus]GGD10468.1 SAM-dependent methyltransferase [Aquisalinus flavus]
MRTDILDIQSFYDSALGEAARGFIAGRLEEAWGNTAGCRVAGFGYTAPYMPIFRATERSLCLIPEGMGYVSDLHGCASCLTSDLFWPLPDASMDRILIVHGLEEAAAPRRLMREVWRVLADDGRLIIVAPHRRGPWAMIESTPFSAGRPWSRTQLSRLLKGAMFTPAAWTSALYFPPLDYSFMIRASKAWERAGHHLWSALAGVTLVEAVKEIAMPVSGTKAEVLNPARVLRPAGLQGNRRASSSAGRNSPFGENED